MNVDGKLLIKQALEVLNKDLNIKMSEFSFCRTQHENDWFEDLVRSKIEKIKYDTEDDIELIQINVALKILRYQKNGYFKYPCVLKEIKRISS